MNKQASSVPLPFFYIGKSASIDRVTNYMSQKHTILTEALERDDTKSIWFSKEHVELLLAEINYASGSGLRVYFGSYETGHAYEGQLCLVMFSTREVTVGQTTTQENVYLEEEPDYEERSTAFREFEIPENPKSYTGYKDFNYGSPCPPLCEFDSLLS